MVVVRITVFMQVCQKSLFFWEMMKVKNEWMADGRLWKSLVAAGTLCDISTTYLRMGNPCDQTRASESNVCKGDFGGVRCAQFVQCRAVPFEELLNFYENVITG